jgi:hypothetical protein
LCPLANLWTLPITAQRRKAKPRLSQQSRKGGPRRRGTPQKHQASPKVTWSQPSADKATLERLLANAERTRQEAGRATNDATLQQQLLEIARIYGEMAKPFEMIIRQHRPPVGKLGLR